MMQIGFTADAVMMQNGKPVTTSRKVAEVFNKQHAHVLRSINSLDCSREFNESNFGLVNYTDSKGEMRPEYIITRDGFTFLAMGFTGRAAARFKEQYINAFNSMEEQLKNTVTNGNEDIVIIDALKSITKYLETKSLGRTIEVPIAIGTRVVLPDPRKAELADGRMVKIESNIPVPSKRNVSGWREVLDRLEVGQSFICEKPDADTVHMNIYRFFHKKNHKRFTESTKGLPDGQTRVFRIK